MAIGLMAELQPARRSQSQFQNIIWFTGLVFGIVEGPERDHGTRGVDLGQADGRVFNCPSQQIPKYFGTDRWYTFEQYYRRATYGIQVTCRRENLNALVSCLSFRAVAS